MINEQNFFYQLVKSDMRAYDNIRKIVTAPRDDYTNGCLLDYPFFKNHYNMLALNLSKQQALDADLKAIQQTYFTGNLNQGEVAKMFFIIVEVKETILEFSQGTMRVL